MTKYAFLSIIAFTFACISTGAESVESADWEAAPPIELELVLQGPKAQSVSLESLKGQFIVMEFWATWCGPCVAAFPEFNELAEKFEGQPVQFISITDEPKVTVEAFLEKQPIHGWVAMDTDRSVFEGFAVQGIPRTVILNPEGRIAGITDPRKLTEQHLDALLAGRDSGIPRPSLADMRRNNAGIQNRESNALFELSIRHSSEKSSCFMHGEAKLTALGHPVSNLIPIAYDMTRGRIIHETELPAERYDFILKSRARPASRLLVKKRV